MSIWCSVSGDEILALRNNTEAANYRGEGEPTVTVDVATAPTGLIRLALFDFESALILSEQVLLTPEAAREVAARLMRAATSMELLNDDE